MLILLNGPEKQCSKLLSHLTTSTANANWQHDKNRTTNNQYNKGRGIIFNVKIHEHWTLSGNLAKKVLTRFFWDSKSWEVAWEIKKMFRLNRTSYFFVPQTFARCMKITQNVSIEFSLPKSYLFCLYRRLFKYMNFRAKNVLIVFFGAKIQMYSKFLKWVFPFLVSCSIFTINKLNRWNF